MQLHKYKLNMQGFSHLIVPAFFILAIGGIGAYVLAASHAATPTSGIQLSEGVNNYCLDDYHSGTNSPSAIDVWSCNKTKAQAWTETTATTTTKGGEIKNSNGLCLNVSGNSKANGATVNLLKCSGATGQLWYIKGKLFKNPNANKCLADYLSGKTDGTKIVISTCSGSPNQTWTASAITSTGGGGNGGGSTTSGGGSSTSGGGGSTASGTGKYAPANGLTYIGVQSTSGEVASFDSALGISHPAIVGQYTAGDGDISGVISSDTQGSSSAVPMVSWNVIMKNDQITNGSEDTYLKAQAAAAKSYGKPLFIRLDWEMNDTWSPNYDPAGGTTPASYVASWQHIYSVFKSAGVTNVAWVWCPNGGDENGTGLPSSSAWYPGDAYVDWVSVDDYPGFTTESELLNGPDQLDAMASFASSHNKPIMLGEWGPNTTSEYNDTVTAYDEIFNWVNAYPNVVKALMYFNFDNSSPKTSGDFLLADHPVGAAEFKKLVNGNSRYTYTVAQ